MKNYAAKDVTTYISSADKNAQAHLMELRELVRGTILKVEESISWGIPFYRYYGLLVGFAAFKKHVSFGFCGVLEAKDRAELEKKGYKTGSKTIQIGFDQKIPKTMIKSILKAQAKKNYIKKKA